MRRALSFLALLVLTVASTACSDDDAPVETGDDPGSTSSTVPDDGSDGPTDGGDEPVGDPGVVISITHGGGFVPAGTDFAAIPTLVLADGTVFTGGAMTMQFPGPALNPLVTGSLPADAIAALLASAEDAGLTDGEVDYGQPGVSDMATTTVTVTIDGMVHTHAAYALGFSEGGPGTGLTDEQVEARGALQDFTAEVATAVSDAATEPYEPSGYQVQAFPREPAQLEGMDVPPNELDWPFPDLPLAALEGADCYDVGGERLAPFAALLPQATQITIWYDAGATYQLSIRATLPTHEPC